MRRRSEFGLQKRHRTYVRLPPITAITDSEGALRPCLHYVVGMELHGSIADNLTSAVRSARRLNGHPVHADTLRHWQELLHHARREIANGSSEPIVTLIVELENELAGRAA